MPLRILLDHISSGLGLRQGHGSAFDEQHFRQNVIEAIDDQTEKSRIQLYGSLFKF